LCNRRAAFNALIFALLCAAAGSGRAADELHQRPHEPFHAGPAVWLEEYWDVKPERFDDFVRAYKTAVYSLARHLPGYRGYTFLTTVHDASGATDPPNASYSAPHLGIYTDRLITPHLGVHLQGAIETNRSVNVGNLILRTHNVVIIHHLRNWSDYRKFRPALAKAYRDKNSGADSSVRTLVGLRPVKI
jgi:hypothetical protein